MAAEGQTSEGTEAPAKGGLPQLNANTYPSQLFWLAVTFGFLFLVLWKVAIPRIGGAIGARRGKIEGDLETAEKARADSVAALAAYESALAAARGRALGVADENRKRITAEVDKAKSAADAEDQKAIAAAETRIQASRAQAATHIRAAAAEAAAGIVERLIGETISADDAAKAVEA